MSDPDICDLLCLDLPRAEALRESLPSRGQIRRAAVHAKALGDPTRLLVAGALLRGGELCVCDLAWICGQSQKLVSHHVRQLRVAGLANSRRDGKMVLYRLTDRGIQLLDALSDHTAPTTPVRHSR